MLEMGLGCDVSSGPGASLMTWLEYLPFVDLYFIEHDAACAKKWAGNMTGATVFTGDEADIAFLNGLVDEAGTDFDAVIDAGGHTMEQQMTGMKSLWKAIVPGG